MDEILNRVQNDVLLIFRQSFLKTSTTKNVSIYTFSFQFKFISL